MKRYMLALCLLLSTRSYTMDQPKCTQKLVELFGAPAFLISFLKDGSHIVVNGPRIFPKQGHLTIIPYIGQYRQDYPMRPVIGIIQFDPSMLSNIPPNIYQQYQNQSVQPGANINFQAVVYEQLDNPRRGNRYNLVLHPWAYGFEGKVDFSTNPSVALFQLNGIQTQDLSVGTFSQLSVNPHGGGTMYSPDNGVFTIDQGRELSTFWSIAISPNKNHAMITFHILVNTQQLSLQFVTIGAQAQTLGEYLNELGAIALNQKDNAALHQAIETITQIVGEPVEIPPQPTIETALETFARNLNDLAGAL